MRCQEVTVSGGTIIKPDFQSCQIKWGRIQNNRSRLFSFGRGTFEYGQLLAQGGVLQGDLFVTTKNEKNEVIDTTTALNLARRVCSRRLAEATVCQSNEILAKHNHKTERAITPAAMPAGSTRSRDQKSVKFPRTDTTPLVHSRE